VDSAAIPRVKSAVYSEIRLTTYKTRTCHALETTNPSRNYLVWSVNIAVEYR